MRTFIFFTTNNSSVIIDSIRYAGGTAWTDSISTMEHGKYMDKMKTILTTSNEPVVLITHHLPSFDCIHQDFLHHDNIGRYASYRPAAELHTAFSNKIILAVHGHIHFPVNKMVNTIPTICNPRGYANQSLLTIDVKITGTQSPEDK